MTEKNTSGFYSDSANIAVLPKQREDAYALLRLRETKSYLTWISHEKRGWPSFRVGVAHNDCGGILLFR